MKHLKYGWYVLRHKWFVFLVCRSLGITWLGIIHDWSKLMPDEWGPYAQHFHGQKKSVVPWKVPGSAGYSKGQDKQVDPAFDLAWLKHQRRNRHHHQSWLLQEDSGAARCLPMPDRYRREMLADWRGAGRAQGTPRTGLWYQANRDKMKLHPDTRKWLETTIKERGW